MSDNVTSTGFKIWLLRLFLAIMALLFLLMLALYVLLGTQTGNRWLLATASRFEPRLSATLESGTLFSQVTLSNVSWSSPGIDIMIPVLEWRWDWSCLRDDTLCLDLLRTQGGNLTLRDDGTDGEYGNTTLVEEQLLPFAVALRDVQLQQTRVDVYNHEITLETLHGAARLDRDGLSLSSMQLRDLAVVIASTPGNSQEETVEAETLILPEIILPLTITLQDLDLTTARIIKGETEYPVQHVQLAAAAAGSKVNVTHLALTSREATLKGQGRIELSSDYPVELNTGFRLLELPPLTGLTGELNISGSVEALVADMTMKGPVNGEFSARAGLLDPDLPFSATLSWQDFGWPIELPSLHSRNGVVNIAGSLEGYAFTLSGDLGGEQLPNLALSAEGVGNKDRLSLTRSDLELLDGTAELSGVLRWNDGVDWQGELLMQRINPAELVIELPGRLNGRLVHEFRAKNETWDIHLPDVSIDGELSGQPLLIQGALQGNQEGIWEFSRMQLTSGTNSLLIDGFLGEQSELKAELEIIDLQTSISQATGSASGTVTLVGRPEALQLDFSLNALGLAHLGEKIGALETTGQLTIDTRRLRAIPDGSVRIVATEMTYQGNTFARLEADYLSEHDTQELKFDLQGEKISLQGSLRGELNENNWSGQLQHSRLTSPLGDWQLDQPLNLSYDREQHYVTIDQHCWLAPPATLCLEGPALVGSVGEIKLSLNEYSSTQLEGLFPEELSWQGSLSGHAEAQWTVQQKPWITLNLSAGNGKIGIVQGEQIVQGDYQQLKLNALLDETEVRADLLLRSENFGQADINVHIPIAGDERSIESEFHLANFQLSILRPLFEHLDELSGTLRADGTISGDLNRPQIIGKVVMLDGRLRDAKLPSEIDQVNLVLSLEGFRSRLSGDLLLGSGRAELAGELVWDQQPTTGWVTLKGTRHKVTFKPELDLLITPDLRLELLEKQLALSGRIDVPYGRTKIRTLPQGAVRLSDDVVVLDKPKRNTAQRALPLSLNVEVSLLDDVEIDAFGLKSRLEGKLALKQNVENPLTGNGSIDLRDGTYRAFGQNLLIKKGVLIFSGPLSKPYIDVDAVRNPEATNDNVTAGIRLRGEAQKPKVTIYSEPAMSQQEAISYLLRGRSLGDSSGTSQDTMVATMLIGAGIGQSEGTITEIGEMFGIKDVAIDTNGEGSNTQVKVSGYILPGVQVGYGVGVFSPVSVITLRYEILPKLILEAANGLQSAVDLLFEFEF